MFDINKDQAKIHMNNFWQYLDELAEKNPEEYKKFISEQMNKGLSNIKSETKEEEKILKVTTYLCLRFKILSFSDEKQESKSSKLNLQIHENNKNEINEVPKILFSNNFQDSYNNKILDEPKVYLNIVHSDKFKKPTDENGQELNEKDILNEDKWKYIPTQFRFNGKHKCLSGRRCDFFDVVLNSAVIEVISKKEELKSSILAYIVRKFCIFLDNKYKLFTDNVKILKNKKYKSVKSSPEDFKIVSNSEKSNSINNPNVNNDNNIKKQIPTKNFYDENKIHIPMASENYPNTNSFYNVNKTNKNNSKGNSELKSLSKTNDNDNDKEINSKKQNKILIQEVTKEKEDKEKLTIEVKKQIINETQMEVKFDFSKFENVTMDNVDLNISKNQIKLKLDNTSYVENVDYTPIDFYLDFSIDVDACSAIFNKKEAKLKLILVKI